MTTLWDTTGTAVVKALAAERRNAGGVASGLALSLIAVVEERKVREAEAAATIAAAAHPCRVLIVVRSDLEGRSRLDAEIVVGGRLVGSGFTDLGQVGVGEGVGGRGVLVDDAGVLGGLAGGAVDRGGLTRLGQAGVLERLGDGGVLVDDTGLLGGLDGVAAEQVPVER